jgi:hypothetical protein
VGHPSNPEVQMAQEQNTPIGVRELRARPRFEPVALKAEIKSTESKETTNAIVLDVSRNGMAVAIEKNVSLFQDNEKITIRIKMPGIGDKPILKGKILRKTDKSDSGDSVNQLAIKFEKAIADNENMYDSYFFGGIRQKARIANQGAIAKADMSYLGSYRQILIDGQLRLFILTLTTGVAFASIFFGFLYNSHDFVATEKEALRIFLSLIALMPAFLSISCAFICAHKSLFIQRIDSYLSVLKERLASFQYPRQYKGWESSVYKLRHIYKVGKCEKCPFCPETEKENKRRGLKRWIKKDLERPPSPGRCAQGAVKNAQPGSVEKLFKHHLLSLEHMIMYVSFIVIYLVSIATALIFLMMSQSMALFYCLTLTAFGLLLTGCLIYKLVKFLYNLCEGSDSFLELKRAWGNILANCWATVN